LASVMRMIRKNTIFTNVGLTQDLDVWWEGKDSIPPEGTIRWDGTIYNKGDDLTKKIAYPNSRFTSPCSNCDILAEEYYDPAGVPISAVIFGGRRSDTVPLVSEAKDWNQGVLYGSTLSSETTAAATGRVGVIRNDPFAMLPFCGYNMGDYFNHWIDIGEKMGENISDVNFYLVNWFRKDTDGSYIWPGFGHNIHVLRWIYERCVKDKKDNSTETIVTKMGTSPIFSDDLLNKIYPDGVPHEIDKLFKVDEEDFQKERGRIREFLDKFPNTIVKMD
ncbi:phosphoenolpyruvate carboxykinase (GTP), partial [Yasminevirus sp. GU-2018]